MPLDKIFFFVLIIDGLCEDVSKQIYSRFTVTVRLQPVQTGYYGTGEIHG